MSILPEVKDNYNCLGHRPFSTKMGET
jgi:hypothetical protein